MIKWLMQFFNPRCRHERKTRHVEWEDFELENGMKGRIVKDYWWTCDVCGDKVQP
jgi:hypothetical protein